MKLQPQALQLNLSLLDQPPTQLPEGTGQGTRTSADGKLLLRAAAWNNAAAAESSGGEDESEANS